MPAQDELLLKLIYQEENSKAWADAQKRFESLSDAEKALIKNSKSVSDSFTGIVRAGRGLNELGRSFDIFGRLFDNKSLSQLGDYTRGIGELGQAFGNLKNTAKELSQGGLLSKLTLGAGAALGGVALGSQIYDATFGAAGGTDTGTILNQIKELIRVGFNTDTLKVEAQVAMVQGMVAENSKYRFEPSQVSPDLAKQLRSLGVGGSLSLTDLQKAQTETEKLLKLRMTEGDVVGSTVAQVSTSLDLIKRAILELEAVNKTAAGQSAQKNAAYGQNVTSLFSTQSRIQGLNTSLQGNKIAMGMALASIERETQAKRLQVAQSYASDLASMEKQYYANRSKVAAQYGTEVQRAEEDHQREMSRMQQDHGRNLRKLAESRDALAIEDEVDNYNIERDRAEEDYNVQAARRSEDFALQLADMDQAFRDQRDARQRQYQEQLQQINQQAQDRRNVEVQNWQSLLQTIVMQTTEAIKQLNQEFAKLQTPTSGGSPLSNYGGGVSSHAWGGYQDYTGLTYAHKGEYYLNAQTTRAMEAVTGQRLSQTSVLNSTGGASITLNMPLTVNGAQAQPEVFRSIVRDEIIQIFSR